MTVAELLRRMSSAELTEWMAHDQLDLGTARRAEPQRAMPYERLVSKLDRFWEPEP
jgi:hypothetical protein